MNLSIFYFINHHRLAILDIFSTILSNFFFLLAILFVLYWILYKKRRQNFVPTLLATALILLIHLFTTEIFLKNYFYSPRPYTYLKDVFTLGTPLNDGSFPSGHLALMTGLLMVLTYYFKKGRLWAFLFLVILGWSRIYNGVHLPTDVLGGFALGLLYSFIALLIVEKLRAMVNAGKIKLSLL